METKLVMYRKPDGQRKAAIVGVGTKHLHTLTMDGTLSVRKLKKDELRHMQPMDDYPPRRALWHFRQYAKLHGSTESAAKLLKEFKRQHRRAQHDPS